MKTPKLPQWEQELAQCRQQLSQLGCLSAGSVVQRRRGQSGSPYRWTRKVAGKTVTVSLSKAQYHWLKQAIANHRTARSILNRMEQLSRRILFATVPGVVHRKPLKDKVLGLK
ncbi:DUF6788 family protein [Pedosphaera parvula]|uniref:Uncharacterized protein n=1 Tax=Pedosphaera parvula (strain Ellin514) TaxID=320771 RepID=B9XCX9_PEDPL|nr:DUF6788 family protein [Pedosphaera parvula]EEF62325.1 hypothetical protein Cflav_PD4960 [Pedosphaera parvula Ellin514]